MLTNGYYLPYNPKLTTRANELRKECEVFLRISKDYAGTIIYLIFGGVEYDNSISDKKYD